MKVVTYLQKGIYLILDQQHNSNLHKKAPGTQNQSRGTGTDTPSGQS